MLKIYANHEECNFNDQKLCVKTMELMLEKI